MTEFVAKLYRRAPTRRKIGSTPVSRIRNVLGFLLLATGCTGVGVTLVGDSHNPLPPTYEVFVFSGERDITRQFEVLGIITYTNPGKYQILSLDDAIPALKEKARSIGANGLIIDESHTTKSGFISTGVSVRARAILIKGPTTSTASVRPAVSAEPRATAETRHGWSPYSATDRMTDALFSGTQLFSNDARSNLTFGCIFHPPDKPLLGATFAADKPVLRINDEPNFSLVDLRFDSETARPVKLRLSGDRLLVVADPDLSWFQTSLTGHSRLLARVRFAEGDNEILDFDIRGFEEAVRTVLPPCGIPAR